MPRAWLPRRARPLRRPTTWLLAAAHPRRGSLLADVTLGIYRFWLTTDIRRFLWSNTELAGESFEYTGTARELLLGFLIAIAVLVPLYVGFSLLALRLGAVGSSSARSAFPVLTFLGQYAVYRARRYRLTRTIYRGVRFHQDGSAWRYALCAVFWWSLIVLTLGLAYPFAQSRLERFKMRHTYLWRSAGPLRGLRLAPVRARPAVLGAGRGAAPGRRDWRLSSRRRLGAAARERRRARPHRTSSKTSGFAGRRASFAVTHRDLAASLAVAVLYPDFPGDVLRWWVSGLRFGELAVRSRLRTAQVYGVYARFVG